MVVAKSVVFGAICGLFLWVSSGFADEAANRSSPELGCVDFDAGFFSYAFGEAVKGLRDYVMDRGVVRDFSALSSFVDKLGAAIVLANPTAAPQVAKLVGITKVTSLAADGWDRLTFDLAKGFYDLRNQYLVNRDRGVLDRAVLSASPVEIQLHQRPGGVCFAGQPRYEDDPGLQRLEDTLRGESQPPPR